MLKNRITEDMKAAMKAKEVDRLSVVRLILSAIKQKEVDERIELTDTDVTAILTKMVKQRLDSISQYTAAQRSDLADKEQAELVLIQSYLPSPFTADEVTAAIKVAISEADAKSIADLGKVMGILKSKLQGRADLSKVTQQVKESLALA
jgi:uncharacterized protein YqeY